jgi:carbamoyltransferase
MDIKNNTSLLLTLGHNSSACLVKNGELFCGYEEERLTKKKSDSSFPKKAIVKCLKNTVDLDEILISWWNDNFSILDMNFTSKHFDRKAIFELKAKYNCEVKYLSKELTHHDAHAYSVLAFFENESDFNVDGQHIIVCDGFGNKREVLSVYKVEKKKPVLLNKVVGYKKSLGLMYQYATSYCGMKMNQDEYKFLGYESKILDVCDKFVIKQLDETAKKTVKALINMPNDETVCEKVVQAFHVCH